MPGGSVGKESTCNAGDLASILGWGRSPAGGHGNPLRYSCLENSMDRGAWRATVHRVANCWTRSSDSAQHMLFMAVSQCPQRCLTLLVLNEQIVNELINGGPSVIAPAVWTDSSFKEGEVQEGRGCGYPVQGHQAPPVCVCRRQYHGDCKKGAEKQVRFNKASLCWSQKRTSAFL